MHWLAHGEHLALTDKIDTPLSREGDSVKSVDVEEMCRVPDTGNGFYRVEDCDRVLLETQHRVARMVAQLVDEFSAVVQTTQKNGFKIIQGNIAAYSHQCVEVPDDVVVEYPPVQQQ